MPRSLTSETGIQYGLGGDTPLFLDVLRPDDDHAPLRPAVIWIHGGGWHSGKRQPNPNRTFAELGFVTAAISYRFSQEAIFPAQIHDVKAAIRFLRGNHERFGIDPERIGAWGHSAGGHLAALAGVAGDAPGLEGSGGTPGGSSALQAVVPASSPTLIDQTAPNAELDAARLQLLGKSVLDEAEFLERARLANPATHVGASTPPFLIVHGVVDDLVAIEDARALTAALTLAGSAVTLLELPDASHNQEQVIGPVSGPITPVRQQIVEFFSEILGPIRERE